MSEQVRTENLLSFLHCPGPLGDTILHIFKTSAPRGILRRQYKRSRCHPHTKYSLWSRCNFQDLLAARGAVTSMPLCLNNPTYIFLTQTLVLLKLQKDDSLFFHCTFCCQAVVSIFLQQVKVSQSNITYGKVKKYLLKKIH